MSGGSPASDRSISAILGRSNLDFDIIEINWFVDFEVTEFIIRNSGLIITEYRSRYREASIGLLIVRAPIIHPIWVIDE